MNTSTAVAEIRQNLNLEHLIKFLESQCGLKGDLKVSQFKYGQSNPTFLLTLDNTRLVLRKQPEGKLLDKTAHDVLKEYTIMNALYSHIPVPKMLGSCSDGSILGTDFFIMEFLDGVIHTDTCLPKVSPHLRKHYWKELTRTLATLHSVNVRDLHGLEYWLKSRKVDTFKNFYGRQIRRLAAVSVKQAQVPGTPELPRLEQMIEWFRNNAPIDETTIVHGDYKMDNVVFKNDQIIGVLDWELSTLGHPLSDLANMLLPYYIDGQFGAFVGMKTLKDYSLPSKEDLMRLYCELTGRTYPIPNWNFCVAFAFFRMAVILQGVSARLNKVQASSAEAKLYAKLTIPSMRYAWGIIESGQTAKL